MVPFLCFFHPWPSNILSPPLISRSYDETFLSLWEWSLPGWRWSPFTAGRVTDWLSMKMVRYVMAFSRQSQHIWKAKGGFGETPHDGIYCGRMVFIPPVELHRRVESVLRSTEAVLVDCGWPSTIRDVFFFFPLWIVSHLYVDTAVLFDALLQRSHVGSSSWRSMSCLGTLSRHKSPLKQGLESAPAYIKRKSSSTLAVSDQSDFERKGGVRGEQSNSPQKAPPMGPRFLWGDSANHWATSRCKRVKQLLNPFGFNTWRLSFYFSLTQQMGNQTVIRYIVFSQGSPLCTESSLHILKHFKE